MTISQMSLKIDTSPKQIAKWVVIGLLGIFVLVYFIRVASYEADYYPRMDGSERAISSVETIEIEELEEDEPTEQQVSTYTVPADRPRYLHIPTLELYNVRIIGVGVDASGALATPRNIHDVGWYTSSGKPGEGKTMVIDGHNGGPTKQGVFKKIPQLKEGDQFVIERGDGVKYTFSVYDNVTVPLEEANKYMVKAMHSPVSGTESVTLITCTGEWSQTRGTYLSRQFLRAILVK